MSFPLRQLVIQQLEQMASEEYQNKQWTENLKQTWFFPDEILSIWYDDLQGGRLKVPQAEAAFSDTEKAALDLVTKALTAFKEAYKKDEAAIDPNLTSYEPWRHVIAASKSALEMIA